MNFGSEESVDLEAIHGGSWESMLRRHPVIDREDGDSEIPGPLPGVNLHRPTGEGNESPAVHMQYEGFNIALAIHEVRGAECELGRLSIFYVNFIIVENTNLNGVPFVMG